MHWPESMHIYTDRLEFPGHSSRRHCFKWSYTGLFLRFGLLHRQNITRLGIRGNYHTCLSSPIDWEKWIYGISIFRKRRTTHLPPPDVMERESEWKEKGMSLGAKKRQRVNSQETVSPSKMDITAPPPTETSQTTVPATAYLFEIRVTKPWTSPLLNDPKSPPLYMGPQVASVAQWHQSDSLISDHIATLIKITNKILDNQRLPRWNTNISGMISL